jgi:hypothetical protein
MLSLCIDPKNGSYPVAIAASGLRCGGGRRGDTCADVALLVGDDLSRHWVHTQQVLEDAFGSSLVTPLLQQDVELGAIFVDRAPQHLKASSKRLSARLKTFQQTSEQANLRNAS